MLYPDTFNKWNVLKQQIEFNFKHRFCKKRDIWWCSIGVNIGYEIYGKNFLAERPILVLRVFGKETACIAPLTSSVDKSDFNYPLIFNKITSTIKLSQVRVVSTKRLSRKIGRLDATQFFNIIWHFKNLF